MIKEGCRSPLYAVGPDCPRFLEFASRGVSGLSIYSRQGASSRLEVGRREGKNTGGCLPTCPLSLSGQHLAESKSHPTQGHLDAAPKCSCTRRGKGHLVRISQRGVTVPLLVPTGRSQTVEKAETRFRAVHEIWEPLEELVELYPFYSALLIPVHGVDCPTFVLFRECVGVYGVKSPGTQNFR